MATQSDLLNVLTALYQRGQKSVAANTVAELLWPGGRAHIANGQVFALSAGAAGRMLRRCRAVRETSPRRWQINPEFLPRDAGKALLYCWVANGFHVLVPKRRGDGFLRVPYGHHQDADLDRIAAVAACDVIGLDGALAFDCEDVFHGGDSGRAKFAAVVVPLLEAHYAVPAREIADAEYWHLHPVPHSAPGSV